MPKEYYKNREVAHSCKWGQPEGRYHVYEGPHTGETYGQEEESLPQGWDIANYKGTPMRHGVCPKHSELMLRAMKAFRRRRAYERNPRGLTTVNKRYQETGEGRG